MAEFEITRYTPDLKHEWDEFVDSSKNGTFLLKRGYMDYHSDRFPDHSLMFLRNGKLFAILPASARDYTLASHPGLTYGGLITGSKATAADVIKVLELLTQYMTQNGFHILIYKAIPHIYHVLPAEEDLYALFRAGATLTARGVSSAIMQSNRIKFRNIRKAGVKRALEEGLSVEESSDFSSFWNILEANLTQRYGVKPVHSLEEIKLLASRFPDNIKLYTAKKGDETLAGVVVYFSRNVAHSQYISASPAGKECGALDLVIDTLVNKLCKHLEFFDFGISTENGGQYLNEDLIYQKEGFGARAVCYDTYELHINPDILT